MQITREDLNSCTVKLSIACESKEVTDGFDNAFRLLTKKLRVPGFRPGKAPKSMLEPYVVPEEWKQEAAEAMIRKVYPLALDEEKLEIDRTTAPQISVVAIDRDEKKFEFSVKVPLPPKVELGDYKGLPLSHPSVEVTEDEIEYELERLRVTGKGHGPVTDRGVAIGDVGVVSIKPDGDKLEEKTMVLIAGQNFPELDQALIGMRVEEIKSVDLTFPVDFQTADFAGQTFRAQVNLVSLSGVTLPDVDDTFAQSLKTENVDDLKNRLREVIGGAKHQLVRNLVHERLVDELMTRSEIAVSDNMWENLASRRLEELAEEQRELGKSLEEYAKENGMSLDEFVVAWEGKAKLEVERALVVQAVFGKEEMKIESRDLGVELQGMADEYGTEPGEMYELLKKNNSLEEIHFRALARKVGDFLLSNAEVTMEDAQANVESPVIEDAAPSTEEAPAPSTPKPKAPRKPKAAATEDPKPETA